MGLRGDVVRMALLGLSVLAAACATTRQTRSVTPSGFLGDYSMLREGEGDEAQLIYIDPAADFSRYQAVWIDSVTIWHGADSDVADLPEDEAQALTDFLYGALQKELAKDYRLVHAPGPGVLRLRVAITEARDAAVAMNVITTTVPQLRVLTTLGGLATDTAVFVGKAGIEGEITDSVTGARLMAAVDERVGTKTLRGMFSEWGDVDDAFE